MVRVLVPTIVLVASTAVGQVPPPNTPCSEVFSSFRFGGYQRAYRYDEGGRLVEFRTTSDSSRSELVVFTHDDEGRVETEVAYQGASVTVRTQHLYDSRGRLVATEEQFQGDHGELVTARTTYEYDAEGNLIAERWDAEHDGRVDLSTIHTYDELGRRATSENLTASGRVSGRVRYVYDPQHTERLVARERYDESAEGFDGAADIRTTYSYDEHGRLIREQTDGLVQSTRTIDYSCWD